MDMQKMGDFLKQLRTERGLTQEQLGENIGVSNKTISRWETGKYMPPVPCLETLSNLYEVSINEIVTGERLSGEDFKESAEENLKFALNVKAKEMKKFEKTMRLIMGITAVLAILAISLITIDNIKDLLVVFLIIGITFIANSLQETEFYLLLMPGNKKFKTKFLSKELGVARLSFANESYMEEYLDITPGSVSVFGLMNDHDKRVQLVIDEDVLKDEYTGCHPCINTSSIKIKRIDLIEKIIPAMKHEPIIVTLQEE